MRPKTRHEFFIERLEELEMYSPDSDYKGMIGRAIERVSALWSIEGHSGCSSATTLGLLNQLFDEWEKYGV